MIKTRCFVLSELLYGICYVADWQSSKPHMWYCALERKALSVQIYRLDRLPNASLPPSIFRTSLSLILNSAPFIRPTAGPSTPLSLGRCCFFLAAALLPPPTLLSKMTPFSFASRLRLASRPSAAATMPLRIFIGIFSCFRIEPLLPSAWRRMSVARCRVRPAVKALGSVVPPPCTTDEAKGEVEP